MIEIGCHYTGAVFLVQIRKPLTLVSIVGIIDIPISALNWLLYIILLYSLYVLALQSSSTALTCNRYLCSRENNWEKSGVVAKFWQFSSGLILQNKTWINDCSFESESWQVIYNIERTKTWVGVLMPGSSKEGKKHGFQHCSSSLIYRSRVIAPVDILFSSNCNIHKSSYGLCCWASDPLVERFW